MKNLNSDVAYCLSRAITRLRLKRGWTQKKLAKKLMTSQPAIARAERGDKPVSIRLMTRIANATGTKIVIDFKD